MELDPVYVDVIVKRWQEFTGKKAKLLTGSKDKADKNKDKGKDARDKTKQIRYCPTGRKKETKYIPVLQ
jgi:hypothetical protein